MKAMFKGSILGACCALVALGVGVLPASADEGERSAHDSHGSSTWKKGPLVAKVRRATARYLDINAALADKWVPATPCVSGPAEGAMGVHFVQPSRLDGVANAAEPEALIYEPLGNGAWRLVGVEYLIPKEAWELANPKAPPPAIDGHLTNLVGEPNRYGLGAFYELHVWAWAHNPNGSFADWNTRVTCDKQPAAM
jgi:hypothetical protein